MRAIAGRQMRGLPQGARIDCVDNSGAKIVEIVTVLNYKGVHRRSPAAGAVSYTHLTLPTILLV